MSIPDEGYPETQWAYQMKVIQKHVMRTALDIHVSLCYFLNIKRKKIFGSSNK